MPRPPVDYTLFDDVLVQAIVSGQRQPSGPIHPADAAEVVRRMAARRFSDGQIAARLGVWSRTVVRIRARHGIASGCGLGNQSTRVHEEPTRRDREKVTR